eukprot:CAMPEP_0185210108 /NCGR_PEP_ID=MMETSP1140-20130426/65011_1 /TAXON_ID=298111 /ORGANISM="Pavlova sp., Strain CCMP459" /LENGTH=58 /DNA_ID=CAMNT_0027777903 /DNA_START=121 /DNA_END=294 /DNA_ORIENTATION=+
MTNLGRSFGGSSAPPLAGPGAAQASAQEPSERMNRGVPLRSRDIAAHGTSTCLPLAAG